MTYTFDTEIAAEYGVNEAIMIQNFIFWISKNAANDKHFHDGRYWTYNSVEAFAKLFPFWNAAQVRNVLKNLINKGVLIKGNYNSSQRDRTSWYAFTDAICEKLNLHLIKITNGTEKTRKCNNSIIEEDNIADNNKAYIDINNNISTTDNTNKDSKDKITKKDINISLFDNSVEGIIEESVRGEREGENGGSKTEPSIYRDTIENLCLLSNSKFAKFEDYAAQFTAPEYADIDMYYYWQEIMDWSVSNNKKKRDWIATTRNWIRADKANNKLHRKQKMGVALSPEAIHYLEMCGGLFDE